MTPGSSSAATVQDMRRPALPDLIRRSNARGATALIDAGVALMLLAAELAVLAATTRDDAPGVAVAACVIQAGAVALRGRTPVIAVLAALTGMATYVQVTHDATLASPAVAVVLTFYTLGRRGATRRRWVPIVAMSGLGLAATGSVSAQVSDSMASTASSWLVEVVAPLAVGLLLARRSRLSQLLAHAAEQLRAEGDLKTAQAAAEERNRVARDLHDVVAHGVSVMVVQAGAARLMAARSAADADNALAVIGGCGRDAMVDVRRIVGTLRRVEDPDFGRGCGLEDLWHLTERIRAAGVPTTLRMSDGPNVPPAVDVVAFRVVQEALTNVVKHAGIGATASVDVVIGEEAVTIAVTNTEAAERTPSAPSGHGLVGMKERVGAYGGALRVGPEPGGGFGVRAQIPLRAVDGAPTAVLTPRRAFRPVPWMSPAIATAMTVTFWLVVMETEVATSSARRGPVLLNVVAVALMAVAASWRRRFPLLFIAVVGVLAVVLSGGLTSLDRSTVTGLYTLAVPLFTVAAWEPRARATLGLAFWASVAGGVALIHHAPAGGFAGALVMGIAVWTAGRVWRAQVLLNAELAETTARLAAERDQRARLAVTTERLRIARDLHGSVAHGVTTMVVQAEAARALLVLQPWAVDAAIRDIEQTGRDALSQLRLILGVLRTSTSRPLPTEIVAAGVASVARQEDPATRLPGPVTS
jgi:signal transduction histidine kinase